MTQSSVVESGPRLGDPTAKEHMSSKLTNDQYLDLYYFMLLNRRLEERLVRLFRQNKIVGGVYSSLGQEAVSIGTAYALEPRDWLAPMIRNIGSLLVKGFKPRDIFTQHMAKYASPTQGKDGTSHFGDLKTRHVVSPISMLGDLIPVMTGVAMAGRYLGQNIVAMTWIGDGGSSTSARPSSRSSKTTSGPIRRLLRGRCRSKTLLIAPPPMALQPQAWMATT